MKNEEKILDEIQELKTIVARLVGTGNLPREEQFSVEALNKAAEQFQKLSTQRGEWIESGDISKYIRSAPYHAGKFIVEEFKFLNYFKKGYSFYYHKESIISLGKELKSRNINLERYMELREDQIKFEKCIETLSSSNPKKTLPKSFIIPKRLKDIISTPAKRPAPEVMREELKKLKDEFFENKFSDYIDIHKSNYAMVKQVYYFERYLDSKIRKRIFRWCDEFNVVNRILKEITSKKEERFVPVPENEMIRL